MQAFNYLIPIAAAWAASVCGPLVAGENLFANKSWQQSGFVSPRFEIQGTEGRSNPLRRQLAEPYRGDELFVRYRLRYRASTIDTPENGNGEFFVLWLDETEGNESSTHSNGVPNLGLHVADDGNRFMVRYSSGGERFGAPLVGDQEFLLVARLWKTTAGPEQPFDQFDLWVDPKPDAEFTPHASAKAAKAIAHVHWLGFSTGGKTEIDDRIEVWDIGVETSWRSILGLPPEPDGPSPTSDPEPVQTVTFREDVFPILEKHCFDCHSGEHAEEGIRLDILDEVLNKTSPRNAKDSRLFQLVSNGDMPPDSDPLKAEEIAVLKAWIDEGLRWDEQLLPTPVPRTSCKTS